MKNVSKRIIGLAILVSIFAGSCVSSKKYKELQGKRDNCETENQKLKDENMILKSTSSELGNKVKMYETMVKGLVDDTTSIGSAYRSVYDKYSSLNENYNDLLAKYNNALKGNQDETSKILKELQKAQQDLMRREDSLSVLEKQFSAKKAALDELSQQLSIAQANLSEKEAAYEKLRKELNAKDSLMNALKNSVSEALVGFENNGLTVTRKGGRVYVSMDEKLMFASGSFTVNAKGQEALVKLAKVLESKGDINILVEGHTDNVPFNGGGQLTDNWDLSVKRATSIVRVMTTNSKIDPKRITAAGRSSYLPVGTNDTAEGKAKNRRTEIILMPDLDKLMEIVK